MNPTGNTLKKLLTETGVSQAALARAMKRPPKEVYSLCALGRIALPAAEAGAAKTALVNLFQRGLSRLADWNSGEEKA